ncbi:MAG: helix-turn-helix transcriptional regulator [Pseudomonadota bacterium]
MNRLNNRRKSNRITGPNPIDVHVGLQLRRRRTLLGFSQEYLGGQVGLTFQQIQKYEKGRNRIGCSRLFDFSRVLDVPVGYFFEGITPDVAARSPRHGKGPSTDPIVDQNDPTTKRETLEMMRAYNSVSDPALRNLIREFVKALGDNVDRNSA